MFMPIKVDYHLHSRCSDGKFSPEGVVKIAAEFGLREISVTDHNTLSHIQAAQETAEQLGMIFIKGCEITARVGKIDYHILAYGFTRQDLLKDFFEKEKKKQEERALKTAQKLIELGWSLELSLLWEKKKFTETFGRLLIVQAILADPKNSERLERERIFSDDDFYSKYLGKGCSAYFPRKKPGIKKVIKLIHLSGGLAIWAHPIWTLNEYYTQMTVSHLGENFRKMRRAGIDGLEVFYPGIKASQALTLYHMCWKYRLIVTGGSDWHGEVFRKGAESFPGEYPVFDGIQPDSLSKILANRK